MRIVEDKRANDLYTQRKQWFSLYLSAECGGFAMASQRALSKDQRGRVNS